MKSNLRAAAVPLAVLASSPSFAAENKAFLAPRNAAAVLADGQPWSAVVPNGKTLNFTFKEDGTGSISGPMPFTLSLTWKVKDDAMCISGKMGTKCLRFQTVPGGLQSWDGDKPDLKFSR